MTHHVRLGPLWVAAVGRWAWCSPHRADAEAYSAVRAQQIAAALGKRASVEPIREKT